MHTAGWLRAQCSGSLQQQQLGNWVVSQTLQVEQQQQPPQQQEQQEHPAWAPAQQWGHVQQLQP